MHGEENRRRILRSLPRRARSRLRTGFACQFLQLVLASRIAEYNFMSSSREDRSELGPH